MISAREMAHTFRREFQDSMTAYDRGMREIEYIPKHLYMNSNILAYNQGMREME